VTAATTAAADSQTTTPVGEESDGVQTASPSSTVAPSHAAPLPASVSGHAVDLTVNLLGAVEIFRDPARPFAADAWRTKRSRDLFCFVASRPHRRTSKDLIIDAFWPDADLRHAEKNFYPTMSHVRKALNSNQPIKQNFLVYRDGEYMLNPECSYRIDIEEFDRLVTEGEAARRRTEHDVAASMFEQAVGLYRGEFMQGCYDEWAEEQRAYYREQYVRLLETLAKSAQKTGDWSLSLRLAQSILRDDPFREDAHCMVMRAHAALGNRAAVKDQYEHLRRVLRKELGVEPAAETQKIYKSLMN
jgi:DNA-binding SARP family transcriptional activator